MEKIQQIAETFYMAAWDLAERLSKLPNQLDNDNPSISLPSILADFSKEAAPFLRLTGQDMPREFHSQYDQIDTIVRDEILPALILLTEEWDSLREVRSIIMEQDKLDFASKCAYIANHLEMYVIPLTSPIEKGLMPQAT